MVENPTPSEENQEASAEAEVLDAETSLGTTQNVAGVLNYILGWVTGIVFLFIEKDNTYVRFQAMQ
jgi:hypothetical protein